MYKCFSIFISFIAACALVSPWEAVIIGAVGGFVSCAGAPLLDLIYVDDPVGAVAVHGFGGIWVSRLECWSFMLVFKCLMKWF